MTRIANSILVMLIAILAGCSSNESLLVPGQTDSDCNERSAKLGVCASPRTILEHKDKISKLYYEEGEAYKVKPNGKIYNIETGEEVIPNQKPESSCNGDAFCYKCNDAGKWLESSSNSTYSGSGSEENPIVIRNRAYAPQNAKGAQPIRDLGLVQEVWFAPIEQSDNSFSEAVTTYLVIREPSWVIGEKRPKRVKRGVVVPTPIAKEVLHQNVHPIDRRQQKRFDDFLHAFGDVNSSN